MLYNQEESLKRIDDWLKKLKNFSNKIKSNFSNIELFEESKKKHYLITFLNYFFINGQIGLYKNIENFIFFFDLVDWSIKDKLTYFYHHYKTYWLDFFELKWNEKIYNKYNIKDFFEKDIYLTLDNKDLENLYIWQNIDIPIDGFIEHFYKNYINDLFESVYYTYYENELMDCQYKYDKKIIINTLSYLYSLNWTKFEVREEMFNKKQKINFDKFLISYYYVWFIEIIWFPSKENNKSIKIRILPKLSKILDELEEKRELIMDKIFDEKYKELKIKKKNWELHLLEWKLEFMWYENKYKELKNKYPNSKITWDNYKWKTTKYEVIEKIKFDNSDNKV